MLYDYTGKKLKKYPTIIGDGIADDSDALQYLVNNNREVRINDGLTIRVTKAIMIDPDKIKLFDGGNSEFIMDGYDRIIFWIKGSLETGMSANPNTLTEQIIYSESGFIIQNCKCRSSNPDIACAVCLDSCMNVIVQNMYINNMKRGIRIQNTCRNISILSNNIYMIKEVGIHLMSSSNLHQINVCNNHISYCHCCIFIENPEALANLQCTGNDIEVSLYPDSYELNHTCVLITSDDAKTGMIGEIVFSGNTIQGHSYGDYIIEIYGGTNRKVRQMTISNNAINNMKLSNIILRKCIMTAISGNAFSNDQQSHVPDNNHCISLESCEYMAITGNTYAAVGHFLQADENCVNVTVVGNSGTCKYDAIEIAEGVTAETCGNLSRYQDTRPW